MPNSQEALERLKEYGVPDDLISALDNSTMRSELKQWMDKAKEGEEAIQREQQRQRQEQVTEQLKQTNVDVDALSKAQRYAVEKELSEGEITPERVAALVGEFELPTSSTPQSQPSAQEQIVSQAVAPQVDPSVSAEPDYMKLREAKINEAQNEEELQAVLQQFPHPAQSR